MSFLKSLFGKSNETKQAKTEEKNFELLKYDGIRAQRLGKLTYAIKCWEEAVALKEEEETLEMLASAYTQANRIDEAQQILNRLIALIPSKSIYLISLANLYYMQEIYEPMLQTCKKALEIDKNNPTVYLLEARASVALKKEIEAIAALTRAIALKADYVAAYQLRAEVLWGMRQMQDAAEDVEAILEKDSDNEDALLLKGEILFSVGRIQEAEECLTRLLQLNPFNEKGYLHLGSLYFESKNLDKALAIYDEAIEINSNYAPFYHERGRIKLHKGDKEGSMADMKKSIELAPKESSRFDGEHNNYENITKNVPW